jgi:hypothetical protein
MAQEYKVTMVTPERVAISHLEMMSSFSHSVLLSIFTNPESAFFHMEKLIFIGPPI